MHFDQFSLQLILLRILYMKAANRRPPIIARIPANNIGGVYGTASL